MSEKKGLLGAITIAVIGSAVLVKGVKDLISEHDALLCRALVSEAIVQEQRKIIEQMSKS